MQTGGSFDIDWEVKDPNDNIVIEGRIDLFLSGRSKLGKKTYSHMSSNTITGKAERQGDYIFTGNHLGGYSFCFRNEFSSFSQKLVDFDIMVESEPRYDLATTHIKCR